MENILYSREMIRLEFAPYELIFKEKAGTSRGTLLTKQTWFLRLTDEDRPSISGYGEAALFEGLSPESGPGFETKLRETAREIRDTGEIPWDKIKDFSSLIFGLEQALFDLRNGGKSLYFGVESSLRNKQVEINGLVWMGNREEMTERLRIKLREGFKCIKIKIGAINLEDEISLLRHIREDKYLRDVEIRLDANGAFSPDECPGILKELSQFDIHSIEQPIKAGQWREMAEICRNSPIDIALDEELIGIADPLRREEMIRSIRPKYLILKPALCFGFSGAKDWIEKAEKHGVGWWVTSALESSVGLDALTQFVMTLNVEMPQGLGTGNLYVNNFSSPLQLTGDRLHYKRDFGNYRKELEKLEWRNQ